MKKEDKMKTYRKEIKPRKNTPQEIKMQQGIKQRMKKHTAGNETKEEGKPDETYIKEI